MKASWSDLKREAQLSQVVVARWSHDITLTQSGGFGRTDGGVVHAAEEGDQRAGPEPDCWPTAEGARAWSWLTTVRTSTNSATFGRQSPL
jgi:hypothetical protein